MAELLAKTACDGLAPLTIGGLTLREAPAQTMTTIAPFRDQVQALGKALKAAHGLDWPAVQGATTTAEARAIWFGRDMALLIGPEPDQKLSKHAALTDQSAGWAVMELSGQGGEEVLARLCPVDLRLSAFPVGAALRTEAKHMMACLHRLEKDRFQIMVFRSLARTLHHDLKTAMEARAARG